VCVTPWTITARAVTTTQVRDALDEVQRTLCDPHAFKDKAWWEQAEAVLTGLEVAGYVTAIAVAIAAGPVGPIVAGCTALFAFVRRRFLRRRD